MWNLIECVKQGRSHVKQGTPCQDKTFSQSYDGTYVIALADGAGSACCSHYGAECVTKCIANELGKNFESYWDENDARIAKDRLFQEINEALLQVADEINCSLKDLASTLLTVAVKDNRYILLHLGDGVIGYYKEGQLKVASAPTNGEFANTTVFTTSSSASAQTKILKGELGKINGFILMSDGPEACLYNYQKQELANGLVDIFEDASTNDVKEVTEGIQEAMDTVISKHTMDDCSLALMVKVAENAAMESNQETHEEIERTNPTVVDNNADENTINETVAANDKSTESHSADGKASHHKYLICISIITFVVLIVYLLM